MPNVYEWRDRSNYTRHDGMKGALCVCGLGSTRVFYASQESYAADANALVRTKTHPPPLLAMCG